MKKIAVIVPTRNRPHNIWPLVQAMHDTMALDTKLILAVDLDDETLPDYQKLDLPEWVSLEINERMLIGPSLNFHANRIKDDFDIIGFLGDDNRPRTIGWDWRIAESMPPLGVVYGNDLIQRWKLPTWVFQDSLIVKTIGYFAAPGVMHLYSDDAWKLLGERLGTLTYLGDVLIEHCHPLVGTAVDDEGYRAVNSDERWSTDGPAFDKWRDTQLDGDIDTLLRVAGMVEFVARNAAGDEIFRGTA